MLEPCLMSIVSYPRMKDIEISRVQLMFIVNVLQVYVLKLKEVDKKELLESTAFQFHRKMELRNIEALVEYLEGTIYGGNKKNRRIAKSPNNDIGLDSFAWLEKN